MKHASRIIAALALVLMIAAATQAQEKTPGSIGRPLWRMKCDNVASVIVDELADGTNLVTCFLYY